MTFPVSEVTICNLALDHLNQQSITNIQQPTTSIEVLCARWYDLSRRSILREHTWNFALKRTTVPKNATPPVFGFDAAYDLPNDYVRVASIGEFEQVRRFKIEGNQIIIDSAISTALTSDALFMLYVHDFTNVSRMDAAFIDAFSLKLAIVLAMPITNNSALKERLVAEYREVVSQAKAVDGQEDPPRRIDISRFKRARRSGRGNVASPWTSFWDGFN